MDGANFGLNVAVEFIGLAVGVPVTIYVIDKLIKRREDKKWLGLKALVKKDILFITVATVSSIRSALGISVYEALRLNSLIGLSEEEASRRIKQFSERFIRDFRECYRERLLQMDSPQWEQLSTNFSKFHNGINNIFSMYGGYLEPKSAEHLIVVRDKLFKILCNLSTFPEAFNAPSQLENEPNLMAIREFTVDEIHGLVIEVLKLRSCIEELP